MLYACGSTTLWRHAHSMQLILDCSLMLMESDSEGKL